MGGQHRAAFPLPFSLPRALTTLTFLSFVCWVQCLLSVVQTQRCSSVRLRSSGKLSTAGWPCPLFPAGHRGLCWLPSMSLCVATTCERAQRSTSHTNLSSGLWLGKVCDKTWGQANQCSGGVRCTHVWLVSFSFCFPPEKPL